MPEIFPIVLNSSNADPNDSSRYIYKFPRGSVQFKAASVALSNINIFYSWQNINETLYNNSRFSIIFPNAVSFDRIDVQIPDGNYTVEDINKYLQKVFIDNNKYFVNNSTGQYMYFYEIITNPSLYKIQLIASKIPTSLPAGYSAPPAGFSYPAFPDQQPSLEFLPDSNFNDLLGFNKDTIFFDGISTKTPQMSPISSVLVTCSLINNKFTNPNNIMFSFVSGSTEYGRMISVANQNLIFSNIDDGVYSEVIITFISQDFKRMIIKDTNLVIYLIVKIE